MSGDFEGVSTILFSGAEWIGVLGFVEFGVSGRIFFKTAFRRRLNANVALKTFESFHETTADGCCQARIPLPRFDSVKRTREFDSETRYGVITPSVGAIRSITDPKLATIGKDWAECVN